MKHIYELVNEANAFLETHPVRWGSASDQVKAIALLLLVDRGFNDKPDALRKQHKINTRAITGETALAVLARVQEWLKVSPHQADKITLQVATTLKACRYNHVQLTTEKAVGAYQIASKVEAAKVSQILVELSKEHRCMTGLQFGLLKSLSNWNQHQAYGAITPQELKDIRERLGYTQIEMAKQIKMAHRQYARYEAGDAPIPDKRAIAVRNLAKAPPVPRSIQGPAKSPRRASRPKLTKSI